MDRGADLNPVPNEERSADFDALAEVYDGNITTPKHINTMNKEYRTVLGEVKDFEPETGNDKNFLESDMNVEKYIPDQGVPDTETDTKSLSEANRMEGLKSLGEAGMETGADYDAFPAEAQEVGMSEQLASASRSQTIRLPGK